MGTITLTPAQLITGLLAICASISCVGGAIAWIIKGRDKLLEPERKQDSRIRSLEERIARVDNLLSKDLERIEVLEEGNRVTQRALLALLAHGIDGNDVDALKEAKEDLQEYLIKR